MDTEILSYIKVGQSVADGSTVIAVMSALATDSWTAVAAAVVSVGAILVPRMIDWYKAGRDAARDADAKDRQQLVETDTQIISKQLIEIANLKAEVADLKRTVERQSCPYADPDGSKCKPGEPPGEWLHKPE